MTGAGGAMSQLPNTYVSRVKMIQPIRQIIEDAPQSVQIPPELRHRRIELIIWPLDAAEVVDAPSEYERARVDKIVIPDRDERNARR